MSVEMEIAQEVAMAYAGLKGTPQSSMGGSRSKSVSSKVLDAIGEAAAIQAIMRQTGASPEDAREMVQQALGVGSDGDDMEEEFRRMLRLKMKMVLWMPLLETLGGGNAQQRPQESRTDKLIDVQILKMMGDDTARKELFQSQAQTANERIHDKDSFYQTLLDHQKNSNEQTDKLRAEIITKSQELMMEKQNSVIRELEKAIKEGKQDDITKLGEKIGNYRNAYENLGKMFGKTESSFLQDLIALFSNKDVSKVITRAIDEIGAGIGKVSQAQAQVPAARTLIPPPPPPPPRRIINPTPPPPPPQGQP